MVICSYEEDGIKSREAIIPNGFNLLVFKILEEGEEEEAASKRLCELLLPEAKGMVPSVVILHLLSFFFSTSSLLRDFLVININICMYCIQIITEFCGSRLRYIVIVNEPERCGSDYKF